MRHDLESLSSQRSLRQKSVPRVRRNARNREQLRSASSYEEGREHLRPREDASEANHFNDMGTTSPIAKLNEGRHMYAHGAYMGAARTMMSDGTWNGILKGLMPEVHKKCTSLFRKNQLPMLMSQLENNPSTEVVCPLVETKHQVNLISGGTGSV